MRNLNKILKLLIALIILSTSTLFYTQTFANSVLDGATNVKEKAENAVNAGQENTSSSTSITDILKAGSDWIDEGKKAETSDTTVDAFASQLIGIGQVLVAIGVVTLLIVSAITAIKWITATPDKQAKLKQQLIGLVVAAVVIFGAIGIWNLVRGIMEDVEEELDVAQTDSSYNYCESSMNNIRNI